MPDEVSGFSTLGDHESRQGGRRVACGLRFFLERRSGRELGRNLVVISDGLAFFGFVGISEEALR